MFRSRIWYGSAVLFLLWIGEVAAHIGDRIYPIFEITDEAVERIDLHDGRLDEWKDLGLPPSLTAQDFFADPTVGQGAPYDPADLDYRIWLGWNGSTGRLYLAMERLDDVYINDYEATGHNMWRYDSSLIFIVDGDHSGGDFTGSADPDWSDEEKTFHNNRTAQQYSLIADAPNRPAIRYEGAALQWVVMPPHTDAGGATRTGPPAVTVLEAYITPFDHLVWNDPEGSQPSPLQPNLIIGFELSIPDFDTAEGQYRALHVLSRGAHTWRYADQFVDGRLLEAGATTAVETDAWGRIKASFLNIIPTRDQQ